MKILLLRPVPGQRALRSRPVLPHRTARHGVHRRGARSARPSRDARRPAFQPRRSNRSCARVRPDLVGIAAMHALETDDVLALAATRPRRVARRADRHRRPHRRGVSRAVPRPPTSAAVVLDDGELALPRVCDALEHGATADDGSGPRAARSATARWSADRRRDRHASCSTSVPLPARHHVAPLAPPVRLPGASADLAGRNRARMSVPLLVLFDLAAARAHRCASDRSTRSAATSHPSATTCSSPTICSGTTRRAASSSRSELRRRGIRKRWMLVQSRVDLVARHPDLLEAWRPIADDFDIFFGLEAATDDGLTGLTKDATVDQTAAGHRRRAAARIRRHRQLRHRSGLARSATSSTSGRSSSGTSCFRPASRS